MTYPVITVLGAGSYGTALAITLARYEHHVLLWGHDPDHVQALKTESMNSAYLPGIAFPHLLNVEPDLERAVAAADDLLIVVPSHAYVSVLEKIKPFLRQRSRIICATKGLEPNTGQLLSDVTQRIVGDDIPLAILSGPTFARELALGMPTGIDVASKNPFFLQDVQNLLHVGQNLAVYGSEDVIGVQLGGVIKNIIAIAVGISDGLGYGANTRISLITRGLAEMAKLGVVLGAKEKTFMGMSGLGDLILTCTDDQSRNRRFGLLLGQGKSIKEAEALIKQVVEGCYNTKEVLLLADKHEVYVPIINEVYQILYCNKLPNQAAVTLFNLPIVS